MTIDPKPIAIELTPRFQRDLRTLSKRDRNIRKDIQPVIEQLQAGELPGDRIPGMEYEIFKVRIKNSDIQKGKSAGYHIFAKIHLTQLGKVMIAAPPGWKPRRLPKKSQKPPISPEEKAKQKAESEERYQYCRAIFERVRPELIQQHYNWYITIDRNSGKYFIDKDYMALFEKFRNKQITGKYVTFRLNETGTCGTILNTSFILQSAQADLVCIEPI
ncbi:MAG: hypothetical protein ACBR13_13690 [Microcoleus sp.]